jgi:hypothetical protein
LPPRAPAGVDVELWTTALAPGTAYVTRVERSRRGSSIAILALARG